MTLITGLPAAQAYDKENDYLAIRQTTAATDKTRRIQGKKITEEVEASVTTLTNTVGDLEDDVIQAQETADEALLLAQQLSSQFVIEPNGWDASTNTPALSDATGTANQAYVVNVTGVRDLGSGSQTWTAGTIAYFAGGIWNPGPAMAPGVTNIITEAGTESGDVVLDADKMAPTASREYVTPDQRAAADAADSPDASNPFVTTSALNSAIAAISDPGIIVVNGIFTPHQFEDTGHAGSFGNGSYNLLNAWGYTNTTAEAQWPLATSHYGSLDVTTMTGDDVIWASAAEYARGSNITQIEALPNKTYVFGVGNIRFRHYKSSPNVNRDSQQYTVDLKDCLYRSGGSAVTTAYFYMEPDDQTDADSNCIDNRWDWRNAKFKLQTGEYGLKVGATRSAQFRRLEFQGGNGFYGAFLLNSLFVQVNTSGCAGSGITLHKGWWSGAGFGNSVSQATFIRCRHRTTANTQNGISLYACDSTAIRDCEFEGTAGQFAIYVEVSASGTVLKNFVSENNRFECGGGNHYERGLIGYVGRECHTFKIDGGFSQAALSGSILLDCTNTQGTTNYQISNFKGNSGTNTFKLKQTNSGGAGSYDFLGVHFQGKTTVANPDADPPVTAANHRDITNYAVWTDDSDLPPLNRITVISPFKP